MKVVQITPEVIANWQEEVTSQLASALVIGGRSVLIPGGLILAGLVSIATDVHKAVSG